MKRIENERTAEKKATFTQDYNKKRGPDRGSEQWARGHDFQRRTQNYNNDRFMINSPTTYQIFSPRPNFAYGNDRPDNRRSLDQRPNQQLNRNDENRSRNGPLSNSNENWRNNGNFSRSPSTQRSDCSQNNLNCQSGSDWPNNSAFRRSDNRPATSFAPCEQKFPQNNNQTAPNVDDTINEISDLCPLNY